MSSDENVRLERRAAARRRLGAVVSWGASILVSAVITFVFGIVFALVSFGFEDYTILPQDVLTVGVLVFIGITLFVRRVLQWLWVGYLEDYVSNLDL